MVKKGLIFYDFILRYAFLLIVSIGNLYIFYLIFTPLTVYLSYFLINLFFQSSLNGTIINFGSSSIEIVSACVGGAAYYLLLILNLSTREIKFSKRIKMILLSFAIFLILNVLRIFIFAVFFINDFSFFDITHIIFWYVFSTLFIILIWFAEVKMFKIREIPIYSDINYLYKIKKQSNKK